ncbi:uncharacterized protein Pyn_08088 [Prunus yedoensis var. nudiflora]|uniref:HVA22-like protein n=1 Tax=Prunus yedoensis var. nudiflora TaxID=2094558 RepID=A0A314XVB3_PRUYE|nr:uncharacterized protein Pyn_08088 [Prunus yedoensis var. nudiflora]
MEQKFLAVRTGLASSQGCPSLSSSDFKAEDDDKQNDTKKLKLKMGFVGLVEFALQCFDVLAWPLLVLLYPLCCTIRAIEANCISDSQRLNAYWVVFSLILLFEHAFMKFLEWLPLWPHIRLMIVFWLVIPHYGGAFYVYNHLIRPCLSMDLQIVINWFNKRKKSSFDRDNFLAEVERYVKENGPEALENIVASTSEKTKSSPDAKEFKAVLWRIKRYSIPDATRTKFIRLFYTLQWFVVDVLC